MEGQPENKIGIRALRRCLVLDAAVLIREFFYHDELRDMGIDLCHASSEQLRSKGYMQRMLRDRISIKYKYNAKEERERLCLPPEAEAPLPKSARRRSRGWGDNDNTNGSGGARSLPPTQALRMSGIGVELIALHRTELITLHFTGRLAH
uniref:Uncharacterized protein n=1 Tax=Oryza sativa subsp. japonica TaxID=39947 RepID=Q6K3Q3_ORYSJ|nr:hypothetical protein [Oryza sativa Japonica Group]